MAVIYGHHGMRRRVAVLIAGAVLAAVAGVIVSTHLFRETPKSAFPAPAPIPRVVGLAERPAVQKLEAARLRASVSTGTM
jgi:hypothetical protein